MFRCVGIGMSCMKRLKSVGESTEPCGTSLRKRLLVDVTPLWTVFACLPLTKVDSHFL